MPSSPPSVLPPRSVSTAGGRRRGGKERERKGTEEIKRGEWIGGVGIGRRRRNEERGRERYEEGEKSRWG